MLNFRLDLKGPVLSVRLEEEGLSRKIFYLDTLKAKAQGKEIAAVALLIKLHLRGNVGKAVDTLSFQEIVLSPAISKEAILLMIETGRLFFRGQKIVLGKKRAALWRGEKHSEKTATLRAFLGELPLELADALFAGWAIYKNEWFEIETDVPWKWIEFFRSGKVLLEGVHKKNFLEEEPKVSWEEKAEDSLAVFPQLVLVDAAGISANLWMDYPGVGKVAFEDLAPDIHGRTRLKKEEASWERDLVEAGYLRKTLGNARYYCSGEKVRETIRLLLDIGWTCIDMQGRKILPQTSLELRIGKEGDSLVVEGKLRFQEKEGVVANSQKSHLFVELGSGHVGLLDKKEVLLEGEWEGNSLRLQKRQIGQLLPFLERENVDWDEPLKRVVAALKNGAGLEACNLSNFQGQLLPYQQKGVEWLQFHQKWGFGALLSDEMGLGKTVQAVAFFSQLRTDLPILIVAPTSLLFNWQSELSRFWPEAKVYLHSGPDRLKTLEGSFQVILTSYALLRIDQELLAGCEFEAALLDESQMIKSSSSQVAGAAYRLKARFKIAMSGTPVENRPEELWSQFRFMMPDLLGEKSEFLRTPSEVIYRRLKPFILRRRKEDVAIELPEKIDCPTWVDFTEAQEALYDRVLLGFKNGLLRKVQAEGLQAHRMEVLEAILRLRQICADPRLLGEEEAGAKAEMLLIAAQELASLGKKVIVFSQFTTFLRLLQKDLRGVGIEPLYLDGSTAEEERGQIVRRFQEEEKPHLFLLSLKAGGVGLNLTAGETVFLLDPWWNDAVEQQAVGRAHRIGQKKTLFVHRYLTPHSIEEKMLAIKAAKTASAEALLKNEESTLSQDDLLKLFS